MPEDLFEQMRESIIRCDREGAAELARRALAAGISPAEALERGFVPGIRRVGELWEEGEFFLPELLTGAEAMKAAAAVLQPALGAGRSGAGPLASPGKVVIGTVAGDIHDIGKSLVAAMLGAVGFTVFDLGGDVPLDRFVETARREEADLVCMSALLTTTMHGQEKVIRLLEEAGLRPRVRVLVGGAPVDEAWARRIGADGYAPNAMGAVKEAEAVLARRG